eukprot:1490805-Rhodomonas_salina.1
MKLRASASVRSSCSTRSISSPCLQCGCSRRQCPERRASRRRRTSTSQHAFATPRTSSSEFSCVHADRRHAPFHFVCLSLGHWEPFQDEPALDVGLGDFGSQARRTCSTVTGGGATGGAEVSLLARRANLSVSIRAFAASGTLRDVALLGFRKRDAGVEMKASAQTTRWSTPRAPMTSRRLMDRCPAESKTGSRSNHSLCTGKGLEWKPEDPLFQVGPGSLATVNFMVGIPTEFSYSSKPRDYPGTRVFARYPGSAIVTAS